MTTEMIHDSTPVPATRWKNPTNETITFSLNVEGVRWNRERNKLLPREEKLVVIPPQGEVVIPSEYDSAIQVVRDGRVQSGLAPQLVKMSDGVPVPQPVHPALATKKAKRS